jgi:carboxymethylenebutenolidase
VPATRHRPTAIALRIAFLPVAATTRTERVTTADAGELNAYLALPEQGTGPGVVVLQEIFGVNDYVKSAADRLARLGYVAFAPDLFWRLQPGATMEHDEAGLSEAVSFAQRLDHAQAVADAISALETLRALPEVTGKVAVLGFCLGGTLAFQVAIQDEPDAAVCYYGSGIAGALEQADRITCPVLFHFGGQDAYIPREQIDEVAALAASRDDFECRIQEDAGHAFDNPAPMFSKPAAAARAWQLTADFLARTLGPQ